MPSNLQHEQPAETDDSVAEQSVAEQTVNISGYRFVHIDNLPVLQADMRTAFNDIGVKGTVLIAEEGINAAMAGTAAQIQRVKQWFETDQRFRDLWLKESFSDTRPFSKMKVRIRPEIITFQPNEENPVSPATNPAPNMSPAMLKSWLDKNADFTLLDTRNTYEIESGTFAQSTDLKLKTFSQFTTAVQEAVAEGSLKRDTPIVTFCTGGIRCEKAAPYLIEQGFSEVYQVEGGILNYFEQCGNAHWEGDCFVFDDRAEINPALEPTGAQMCEDCHRAVHPGRTCACGALSPALPLK